MDVNIDMNMKWCVLVFHDGHNEHSLGVYHFQEFPRVGEYIDIAGSEYKVTKVVHEFIVKTSLESPAYENKVIIYVK